MTNTVKEFSKHLKEMDKDIDDGLQKIVYYTNNLGTRYKITIEKINEEN